MRKPSSLDYAFAVGRVRALERYLVPQATFKEAADEKNLACALKIIFDMGVFSEEKLEIKDSRDLEKFLFHEKESLLESISGIFLDRAIFRLAAGQGNLETMLTDARKISNDFIVTFLRHKIDLGNLKILIRAKYRNLNENILKHYFLKGGFIDDRILLKNFELSFSEIGEILKVTAYKDIWDLAIDSLEEHETFVDMERNFENFMMRYLRRAKYIVFGPEPVFAYTLAKLKEIELVRLLGVGKLIGIPPNILKNRMSETYV